MQIKYTPPFCVDSGTGGLQHKQNKHTRTLHVTTLLLSSKQTKHPNALRFLGSSQTLHKRIAPPRSVITIQPNAIRGLHRLQPNMAHRSAYNAFLRQQPDITQTYSSIEARSYNTAKHHQGATQASTEHGTQGVHTMRFLGNDQTIR